MDWGPGGLANRCPPKSEADNVGTYVSRFLAVENNSRRALERSQNPRYRWVHNTTSSQLARLEGFCLVTPGVYVIQRK